MSSPSPTALRGLEAFAYRDFRWYQYARVAAILGSEAQSVAVAWQVYSLTHRALDLGYTGLALFLPGFIFLLPLATSLINSIAVTLFLSVMRCNVFAPSHYS